MFSFYSICSYFQYMVPILFDLFALFMSRHDVLFCQGLRGETDAISHTLVILLPSQMLPQALPRQCEAVLDYAVGASLHASYRLHGHLAEVVQEELTYVKISDTKNLGFMPLATPPPTPTTRSRSARRTRPSRRPAPCSRLLSGGSCSCSRTL